MDVLPDACALALIMILLLVLLRLRRLQRRVDALDARLDAAGIGPPPAPPRKGERPRKPRVSVLP